MEDIKSNEIIENLMKEHPQEKIVAALNILAGLTESELELLSSTAHEIDEDHS